MCRSKGAQAGPSHPVDGCLVLPSTLFLRFQVSSDAYSMVPWTIAFRTGAAHCRWD